LPFGTERIGRQGALGRASRLDGQKDAPQSIWLEQAEPGQTLSDRIWLMSLVLERSLGGEVSSDFSDVRLINVQLWCDAGRRNVGAAMAIDLQCLRCGRHKKINFR